MGYSCPYFEPDESYLIYGGAKNCGCCVKWDPEKEKCSEEDAYFRL